MKIFNFFILLLQGTLATAQIGQTTLHFTDDERDRKLITELWYATDEKVQTANVSQKSIFILPQTVRDAKVRQQDKQPLVVISHGTGGDRLSLTWLSTALAKEGCIVAAVNHWGNTWDNKTPEGFMKIWERPRDISFVVSRLLQDPMWRDAIDDKRIAAVGFSLGGYTVITLAGGKMSYDRLSAFTHTPAGKKESTIPEFPELPSYLEKSDWTAEYNAVADRLSDKRISCVVAMAPAIGQGFGEEGLKDIKRPVLLIGAEADSVAPIATNALYYNKHIEDSKLKTIPGAGHYIFLNACTPFGKEELPPFLCNDGSGVGRLKVHDEVTAAVKNFINNTFKK